jgi:hypothetical protein
MLPARHCLIAIEKISSDANGASTTRKPALDHPLTEIFGVISRWRWAPTGHVLLFAAAQ